MIDFSNNTTKTILDETADLVLQQIDLLLDTDKGEVLGEQDFGTDYDKFLYEVNVGNNYIRDYIERNIENNVDLLGWQLDVQVETMMGTLNDIILVNIELSKDRDVYSKVYKIDKNVSQKNTII